MGFVKTGVVVVLFMPIFFGMYVIFNTVVAQIITGVSGFVSADATATAFLTSIQNVISVIFTIAIGGSILWWVVSATRKEDETTFIGG